MRRIIAIFMTLMLCLTVLHTGETMAHEMVEALEHHEDGHGSPGADDHPHVEAPADGQHVGWFHHAHDTTSHLLVVVPVLASLADMPIPRGHAPVAAQFTQQHNYIRIDRPPRSV